MISLLTITPSRGRVLILILSPPEKLGEGWGRRSKQRGAAGFGGSTRMGKFPASALARAVMSRGTYRSIWMTVSATWK